MRELLEQIIGYLPRYFVDFSALVAGPKRYMRQRNVDSDTSFNESLLFLALSLAVSVLMIAPVFPAGTDLWTHVGRSAVTMLLTVALAAVTLRTSWWLVGGKASVRSFFVVYAYYSGAMFVGFTLVLLLALGTYKVLVRVQPDRNVSEVILWAIIGVGILGVLSWSVVGWGAFRELNGLSKLRSFYAFVLFQLISVVPSLAAALVGIGMS